MDYLNALPECLNRIAHDVSLVDVCFWTLRTYEITVQKQQPMKIVRAATIREAQRMTGCMYTNRA